MASKIFIVSVLFWQEPQDNFATLAWMANIKLSSRTIWLDRLDAWGLIFRWLVLLVKKRKMAGTVIIENICHVIYAMWACGTNLS
jgi:hypothetical protein